MGRSGTKSKAERLLDTLIWVCERPFVRKVAAHIQPKGGGLGRGEVVDEVVARVLAHYAEHRVETSLVARQASVYQKFYFRQRIRGFAEKLAGDGVSPAGRERYRGLIARYREQARALDELEEPLDRIQWLARYYIEDMVSELNPAFFLAFKQVALGLFSNFVRALRVEQSPGALAHILALVGREPVFFVPNHISNADHIPICLAINDFGGPQPLIA